MLRDGTAALGTATLVGAAGCLGWLPFTGGGAGTHWKWLPGPGALVSDADHYDAAHIDMKDVAEHEDEFDSNALDYFTGLESNWSPARFDWDDTTGILIVETNTVVMGDFAKGEVVGDLEAEGWDEEREHGGFAIMADSTDERIRAVSDGTLVSVPSVVPDPVDTAEAFIDAANGDAAGYVDESDDMRALTEALGTGTTVHCGTVTHVDEGRPEEGRFADMVGRGFKRTVTGSTTDVTWVVLFEERDDVDTNALEEWVTSNDGTDQRFGRFSDDVSYEQEGRAGIIETTMDTDDIY